MALLSNYDIIEICNHLKLPLVGVFQKDKLPRDKPIGYYIINLQSSTDGNGTHWVCLSNIPGKKFFYDSFGFGMPQLVQKFIGKDKYYINDTRLQSTNSTFCGWYCIAIMYYTFYNDSKNIESRIKSFNNMFNQKEYSGNYDKMIKYFQKIFTDSLP